MWRCVHKAVISATRITAVALVASALVGWAGAHPVAAAVAQAAPVSKTTTSVSQTGTTKTVTNPKPVLKRGLTVAELQQFPIDCLKVAGQKHVRQISRHEWQGTFNNEPFTVTRASVWISGPYRTIAQAQRLVARESKTELAYAGGIYVATATRRGALSIQASFAAACLASATEQPMAF